MTPAEYLSSACTQVSSTNVLMKRKLEFLTNVTELDFMLSTHVHGFSSELGCCVTPPAPPSSGVGM